MEMKFLRTPKTDSRINQYPGGTRTIWMTSMLAVYASFDLRVC